VARCVIRVFSTFLLISLVGSLRIVFICIVGNDSYKHINPTNYDPLLIRSVVLYHEYTSDVKEKFLDLAYGDPFMTEWLTTNL
jgi:hypothetical protein